VRRQCDTIYKTGEEENKAKITQRGERTKEFMHTQVIKILVKYWSRSEKGRKLKPDPIFKKILSAQLRPLGRVLT
jgi:hypothetical protein